MPRTFNELCTQLNLQHYYNSPNQLETLERWCGDNISHDRKFYGSPEERYNDYLNLAQEYLDDFLPFVATNAILPIAQLDNMTVIQYAAFRGFDHFLHQFTAQAQPEQLNLQTPAGMTALHLAALGGYYHTVNTLLNYGASPTIANSMGKFPLQCTLFMPMSAGENKEPLKEAKTRTFRLLQAKAPFLINSVDSSGETAVHSMACHGFTDLIRDLVQEKNTIVTQPNNFKKYPIHFAILNGQLQSAKELLAFNGMAALTDAEGRTPLHYAAKYANEEFVEACCNAHAQIDAYDKAAMTPLLLAAEVGNLSLVQLLIQKGANPLFTDYRGFTLLHFATKSKNPELVSWILDNLEINVNAEDHATHTPLYYIQDNPEYDNQTTQIVTILMSKGATSQLRNTLEK